MNVVVLIHGKGFETGKDTVGKLITNHIKKHNPQRKVFCFRLAEKVKNLVQDLTGIKMVNVHQGVYDNSAKDFTHEQKETFIPIWNMTLGQMLQKLATEACRDNFDSEIWVKSTATNIANQIKQSNSQDDVFIIPDFRFENEAHIGKFITQQSDCPCITTMIKVIRDTQNISSRDINHSSETQLDNFVDWDHVVRNDKDLDHLDKQCQRIYQCGML